MEQWSDGLNTTAVRYCVASSSEKYVRPPGHSPNRCRSSPGTCASNISQFAAFRFAILLVNDDCTRIDDDPLAIDVEQVQLAKKDRFIDRASR
jgi:hypothetical protein